MKSVVVRGLSPEQEEAWEFQFEALAEGGGTVCVPSVQEGYPIDWPPRVPAQAEWLRGFAPEMQAVSGAGWTLKPHDWERLLKVLKRFS